jgi:hypothetical protein
VCKGRVGGDSVLVGLGGQHCVRHQQCCARLWCIEKEEHMGDFGATIPFS